VATITELEIASAPTRKRRSFHVRYRKLILAGRILIVAAIAVGALAISQFAYNAFNTANCYDNSAGVLGDSKVAVDTPECRTVLSNSDDRMRVDASVAMLAVALVLSSVVCYRKARRYKPRAPVRPIRPS
jgi:hypothetical protein